MMNDQKGFGVVEVLVVIVIVGLISTVGWLVYDRQQNKVTTNDNSSSQQTAQKEVPDTDNAIDTTIYKVDIKMQTAEDISKLPDYTPASFIAYMLKVLQSNKYTYNSIDGVDSIPQYQISRISSVNVEGGQVPVDKKGESHAGGAPVIWVLTPSGTWDQETLNGPLCKSKNGGLIYEEFAKECSTDPDTDSWINNPNGSIKTLNN